MSDPWPEDPLVPYNDCVPERHIDLTSGTCNKIMSALSFKIMKETLKSYVEYFTN